jgi:hypothetical protein
MKPLQIVKEGEGLILVLRNRVGEGGGPPSRIARRICWRVFLLIRRS